MLSPLPAKLSPPLSDRDAIKDTIYRAVTGLDTNDPDLFDSAFTDKATFDIDGKAIVGREALRAHMSKVCALDTTHIVTNVRVDVHEGASTASATASALAQHYRGGQGADPVASGYMVGVLYALDLVRDEEGGVWRAEVWRLRIILGEGDVGVLTGI